MSAYALPVVFALAIWWASTGVILLLVRLPRQTYPLSILGATLVLGLAMQGLASSSEDPDVQGACLAFVCAIAVWGWLEMGFLLGFITGPQRTACKAGCSGAAHFRHATNAVIYHELAILAGAVMVVAITWKEPNQVGCWTFLLLWGMRLSAKLNLYLGVSNRGEQFLPAHLKYLASFFGKRPINWLFPFAVTAATVLTVVLYARGGADTASPFEVAGYTLVGTLSLLALIEHWFLVLPLATERLWQWRRTESLPLQTTINVGPNISPNIGSKTS